ncbi:MAG: ATP-binding cassette domain-containing protein [Polyangiaceae bacterium]
MVRARGLRSPHGSLCELDLEIPGGSYWALCGPAGSGKSGYVRLLSGLDAAGRGELYVDGTELGGLAESERAAFRARAVSVVFPSGNLVAELTLEENLELPLLLAPVPRSERRQRAESALEMVGLYKLRHRKPAQVSLLDTQRAAFARGLLSGANLILADEPCRDLAPTDAGRLLDSGAAAQPRVSQDHRAGDAGRSSSQPR